MRRLPALAFLPLLVLLAACSSGGSDSAKSSNSTSAPPPSTAPSDEPLLILVTNDDGFDAPGIDILTSALEEVPNVEISVVAPATNQSGTGSTTSATPPTARDEQTASGHAATAVDGYPADSVIHALDTMSLTPDLVVSGINAGQNLGALTELSGTVGAAKAAADRGIPAVAASQGVGDDPQYEVGASIVVAWVEDHRDELVAGEIEPDVVNINIPTCTIGSVRGIRQVPLAATVEGALEPVDCASSAEDVADDIAAFLVGFATVTQLTPAGETVTSSTTFPQVTLMP